MREKTEIREQVVLQERVLSAGELDTAWWFTRFLGGMRPGFNHRNRKIETRDGRNTVGKPRE